jgi:hypothetical protein
MKINKKTLIFSFIFFLLIFNIVAQNKNDSIINYRSIYFFSITNKKTNTFNKFNINRNLNLQNLDFVILNLNDLEEGMFSVPFESFLKKLSKYIYDSYNKAYRNKVLNSTFFKGYDLRKLPFTK